MVSPGTSETADFRRVKLDELRRAIALYLARAYPDGEPPPAVLRRLNWPESDDVHALLTGPPFERGKKPGPNGTPIMSLRLGNARYPHMKLQVQPWANASGYLLSVNSHDQVQGVPDDAPGLDEFRAVQAMNQDVKERIEADWDAAGFPTFNRYLRDYLKGHVNPEPTEA